MGETEIAGTQVTRIQELEKRNDILISVVLALKKGDLGIEQIELQDSGFTVTDESE
jgi:hypothetical protein|tara:strand:+ start:621 stop:788 length:168 start_codon:yes stop_codon:yes gene_type:complete